MLTNYQRLCIAIRHGVLIKPEKTVDYIASITKQTTWPQGCDCTSLYPLKADNNLAAAREAAERYTRAFYGDTGAVSFVQQQDGEDLFLACIGEYRRGVTRGFTLSILIREYNGA